MILKIIFSATIGGIVGYVIGLFLRKLGGSCPLTCTPWGSIITGAVFGILFALNK